VTSSRRHPFEQRVNAPIADILEAIEHGFRAQADVKGKLAELYLHRHLQQLRAENKIIAIEWNDADGQPDFVVVMPDHRRLKVECKNIRSDKAYSVGGRDREGRKTRGYMVGHFDVLAACTFNQTGEWRFRFIGTSRLARRDDDPQVLKTMQLVPLTGDEAFWFDDFLRAVEDANH
jgi:hypothetical protein